MNANRIFLGVLAALLPWVAGAQSYPSKPVRVIVPYSAGGSADLPTRPILDRLSGKLGRQFLLDHRPGAGGEIGTAAVARAAPDGYTLLVGAAGPITILPELRKLSYDPDRDLVPVAWLGDIISGFAVSGSLGVNTMADLLKLATEKPGQLSYPSAGYGTTSHLRGEMLVLQGGVKLLHVPYKSNVDAVPDLLSGNVHMMFESLVFPLAKSGKVKLLAVLSEERFREFPNVPTMREAGFPDFNIPLWYALYAPAGTPRSVLEQLNREVNAAASDKTLQADLEQRYVALRVYSLDQIARFMRMQREMYRQLIVKANIKLP